VNQETFERRHTRSWVALEEAVGAMERGETVSLDFPSSYRRLCQHLALARHRLYSASLIERLNRLAVRCHRHLYSQRASIRARVEDFIIRGFPQAVRRQWRLVLASSLLFYVPLIATIALVSVDPDRVYMFMDPMSVASMEEMYDPASAHQLQERESSSDLVMFGYYIRNNIGIALRTFGAGVAFAVGSVLVLISNGLTIGAVAGHLQGIGYGETFWPFVIGHGSFELTAIVLAGAAGLQLGMAVVSPGRRSRALALREEALDSLPLVYGFSGMLLVAAFIEAFWSSSKTVPPEVRYAVGAALWVAVFAWLGLSGRARVAR